LGHDISESDIEHLLTQVESKDSKLNFEEFIAWNRLLWKDDMEAKFNKIDSDSSGYIDKIQLKAYVVDMEYGFTEEELDDMCYEMDSNGDERIYVDDFINVMVRRHVDCMFVMHQARFH
jgi:Ca2+-binding EF-hand superfamily protein